MKKIEKSWQNNGERESKGEKNRTRRKVVLELFIGAKLMAVYIYSNRSIYSKSFIFFCTFRNKLRRNPPGN